MMADDALKSTKNFDIRKESISNFQSEVFLHFVSIFKGNKFRIYGNLQNININEVSWTILKHD